MVMLHIIIALASIVGATYSLFKPSQRTLLVDWSLIAATIISGVALVIVEPSKMLHACIAGLAYVTIASILALLASGRYKTLRKQKATL